VSIGIFILLKLLYTVAGTNDLHFLLGPTNKIVELLSGSQARYIQNSGYFHESLNIVIDKSCSGFNFWLLCFIMLSFLTLKYFKNRINKILTMTLSLIGAYFLTVLVNSSRIFASIIIENQIHSIAKYSIIHESIGIITNLTFLILIYLITERILNKRNTNANIV
jgi:exosortase K